MNILAIETTTVACSIALKVGEQVFARHEEIGRGQAQVILPWIEELMAQANMALPQLETLAFGCGPGGFTGIRVSTALVQALAFVNDLPVVPVSSLAVLAQTVMDACEQTQVMVVQDAKMGQLYCGQYRQSAAGIAEPIIADYLANPTDIVLPVDSGWALVGDGWSVYPEAAGGRLSEVESLYPSARSLLKMAEARLTVGDHVRANEAFPVYLRGKDAWVTGQ